MLDGRAASQGDLDDMKEWVDRNLMKFSKKCKVLHLRRENPLPSYRLMSDGSEEKALVVLADSKLNTIQQLPGSKESHQLPQLYNRSRAAGLSKVIILNLFSECY